MRTKQSIAIIGASGKMGSAIAGALAGSFRLLLFSENKEKVLELQNKIRQLHPGAEVEYIGCPHDACWEADIIIPAVPYAVEKQVAEAIRDVATQKIVISISNPFQENFDGLLTEPGTSAAETLQQLLPNSKVVKAFNTSFAPSFERAGQAEKKPNVFIAGDDEAAVQAVQELVRSAGFTPVEAGKLSSARILEQMALLLVQISKRHHDGSTGWKLFNHTTI